MNKKRLLALLLALTMVIGMVPTVWATDTSDTDTNVGEAIEESVTEESLAAEPEAELSLYEQMMAAETANDMYALLLANQDAAAALTADEIAALTAKAEKLPEDDSKEELLETLAVLPAMACSECGEFGGHTEDCVRYAVVLANFANANDYASYKYVSDKDGGVRENEHKIVDVRGQSFAGIPVLSGNISYEYSDVIIGMNAAGDIEWKVPASAVRKENENIEAGYDGSSKNSNYPGAYTCVNASLKNKSVICDSNEYYVIYKDIGTYDDKDNINLKVSVADYQLINDSTAYTSQNMIPTISLRISSGRPGVEVSYVSWIELKYEFIDDNGNPVEVCGNTTYYDVDGSQLVHLNGKDNSCKGIYVVDNCHLYLGTFSGSTYNSNGIAVFERLNKGYPTDEFPANSAGVVDVVAFTEIFKASTMYRTFSFIQNRAVSQNANESYKKETDITIDGSNRYHSDEWGGGLIYHSGLPVSRRTGSLTVSKTVPEGYGDRNKEFSFNIILSEKLNGKFGDLTFDHGVANFTLKHGESVTATGLYEFLAYEITESNNANYDVYVNDEKITGTYSGSLIGDNTGSGTTSTVTFQNDHLGFKNVYQLGNLKITKEGIQNVDHHAGTTANGEERQSTIFTISGTSASGQSLTMDVTIHGNGSVTVVDLPVGTYTVTEKTNWSWRYTPINSKEEPQMSQTIVVTADGAEVTFNNSRKNIYWLSGDNFLKNLFNKPTTSTN